MDLNKTFAMKLWWGFRTSNSLWAKFMQLKYASKRHPSDCGNKIGASSTWQRMLKIKNSTEKHMKWFIGKGGFNIWKEYWMLDTKLQDLGIVLKSNDNLTVAEALLNTSSW